MDRALAMVIEAQAQLPTDNHWELGFTPARDRLALQAARQGEAMNLVNARYGSEPGLKAYTLSRTGSDPSQPKQSQP